MPNNLVKFVYAASATPEQIANFSADTLYFVGAAGAGEGGKLYKGSRLYDAGASAAAAELQQLKTYIGTLPVSAEYTDLIDYIDKNIAAAEQSAKDYTDTLDNSLADVAKSGAAADVSIADAGGLISATNVEGALQEIATSVANTASDAEVTIVRKTGAQVSDSSNVSEYEFYQGGNTAADLVGTIEISKDLVATSGSLVDHDGEGNPGTFIEMIIANGQPFYIDVADLIEYNSVSSTDEITLSDTNHVISATVGEIAASKIIYRAADDSDPEHPVAKQTVAQKIAELDEAIADGIDSLDSTATIATVANGVVTIKAGLEEVDGIVSNDSNADITLAKVATTGSAEDVAYGASTAKAALDTIGAIPATAQATTVVGYVDEKVSGTVSGLDADVDAALSVSDTDPNAVAVVSGVTEVDGVITAVDSVAVDAAGAATTAEANAKAYTDAALTWQSLS